ncbi:MAG TPA: GspE/PulE family protein, partial [Kiritimatiellia bacterium]|nr:GspE/PulE family protein [Kiritimatiellia bacterium]
MTSNDDYVVQLLREQSYVSAEQVEAVANSIKQEGETTLDILVQTGIVTEDDVLSLVAAQFGMEYVHVNPDAIDPAVTEVVPADVARKYGVVPVTQTEDTVTVALSDPMAYDTVDSLRYVLKMNVEAVVAPRSEVRAAVDRLYPESFESIYGAMSDSEIDVAEKAKSDTGQESDDSDAPVIRLVSMIITEACKMRASDIHLEPMERTFRVRYRIDGVLRQMDTPPKRLQAAIISRVKIMSNMKISEKRVPQDGRIQIKVQGRDLDLRVSSVPTNHGESIVMRILDKSNLSLGLPQLGFLSDDQNKFERLISLPDGVLLVTGPTGSGKTTTLYACLGQINLPDRKIITVEDPVEYQMSGINQVQVNKDVGLDFSAALRSILRQAPNIVMIGEIRDHETADIAMEAALTGHL